MLGLIAKLVWSKEDFRQGWMVILTILDLWGGSLEPQYK